MSPKDAGLFLLEKFAGGDAKALDLLDMAFNDPASGLTPDTPVRIPGDVDLKNNPKLNELQQNGSLKDVQNFGELYAAVAGHPVGQGATEPKTAELKPGVDNAPVLEKRSNPVCNYQEANASNGATGSSNANAPAPAAQVNTNAATAGANNSPVNSFENSMWDAYENDSTMHDKMTGAQPADAADAPEGEAKSFNMDAFAKFSEEQKTKIKDSGVAYANALLKDPAGRMPETEALRLARNGAISEAMTANGLNAKLTAGDISIETRDKYGKDGKAFSQFSADEQAKITSTEDEYTAALKTDPEGKDPKTVEKQIARNQAIADAMTAHGFEPTSLDAKQLKDSTLVKYDEGGLEFSKFSKEEQEKISTAKAAYVKAIEADPQAQKPETQALGQSYGQAIVDAMETHGFKEPTLNPDQLNDATLSACSQGGAAFEKFTPAEKQRINMTMAAFETAIRQDPEGKNPATAAAYLESCFAVIDAMDAHKMSPVQDAAPEPAPEPTPAPTPAPLPERTPTPAPVNEESKADDSNGGS
jgi:hypothetical protein